MAIGSFRSAVINVNDLATAENFWSEVTGLSVIGRNWMGRFSYLGTPDPWKHLIILQLVTEKKGEEPNRAHIDITPQVGVDDAIARIVAIGGTVRKEPSLYPRPGSHPDGQPPLIDWAVMRDPFGNEFCLVSELTPEQRQMVLVPAAEGFTGDQAWRAAAGVTPSLHQ